MLNVPVMWIGKLAETLVLSAPSEHDRQIPQGKAKKSQNSGENYM
jgi:hypothetical protein